MKRIWYWIRYRKIWPQCKAAHRPYKNLTDAECDNFWVGKNENKKTYYCLKNRFHLGKHKDIHDRKW